MSSDPVVINWSDEAERLGAAVAGDAAWHSAMAHYLVEDGDELAVDVGCGGAGMAIALSAALPARARIVGIDGNQEVLDAARRTIEAAGIAAERIQLANVDLHHDLSGLPDVARDADIVWASASIHHVGDQQAAIDSLANLLAPGGRLALAEGGLRGRHLPWDLGVGEPGLELRLHAAEERWFARMRAALPGTVRMPYGWTTALGKAGLVDVHTRSTMIEKTAPLDQPELTRVLDGFAHRVQRASESGDLDEHDVDAWTQVLDKDDDAWLGHRDDVYTVAVRSVHIGRHPG